MKKIYDRANILFWIMIIFGIINQPPNEPTSPLVRVIAFIILLALWYPLCGLIIWLLGGASKLVTR